MPEDFHYLSLDEVARRLKERKLSSVEATRSILGRIEKLDPKLKAYATLTTERALADAARLDAETAAGTSRGVLHGVPIAVKDLCNTAGVATAAGMPIHRKNVPAKDATVVARLKAAGAVILGKLQMTEGAYGAHHPDIPAPLNPWNAAYWTGSSSSGSGAATAAGLCFASLGSDTGGSIRFPSTMNGLTGLKPTWGRVSRAGVFALAESLDHIGPMTRSALDAALVLGVIAGPDADDPTSVSLPVPDYAGSIGGGVRGRRIGVPTNLHGIDGDAQRALDGAAEALKQAGASVVDVKLPASFDQAGYDWVPLCAVEAAVAHEATYPARAKEYGPVLAGLLDTGRKLSATDLAKLQLRRAALAGELNSLMSSVDLLLVPVMGTAAWSIEAIQKAGRDPDSVAARLRYTAPFDLSGHPTLTLPGGMTRDGVPAGFQIVGRAFDEAGILAAGHAYQQLSDWHLRRPPP
ncbi:MAG: amidase [Reyranella sp.]|uniref:amidase n=1 Tax=Reyranella sp. TaxID=1929291 RepID=UPI00122B571B|nr:amidase [Reyranella sp.]TAJ40077.1 MAG: amidase [Reyranella sp.]